MKNIKRLFLATLAGACFITGCMGSGNDGDLHYSQGIRYYNEDDYINAEIEFRQALGKDLKKHSVQELYTTLGVTYEELEEYDSSITYHRKALALDSNYAEAWVNLGIVYRVSSQLDLAEDCYKKALSIDPSDPELHSSMGTLAIVRGEPEEAVKHLEKAIELDASSGTAHGNYALALAMTGDFEGADKELKKAVSLGYKNGEEIQSRIDDLRELED